MLILEDSPELLRHSCLVSVLNHDEIVIMGGYYNGSAKTGNYQKGKLADALVYNKAHRSLQRVIESGPFAFDSTSKAYLVSRQRVVALVRDEQKVAHFLLF